MGNQRGGSTVGGYLIFHTGNLDPNLFISKASAAKTFAGIRNTNLIGGGEMRWGIATNTFSWTKAFDIMPGGGALLVDGISINKITIATGSVSLAAVNDVAYITIPKTDGATAVVTVCQYNAVPTGDDKLIIAWRDSDSCLELIGGGWLVYGTIVEAGGKRDNYVPKSLFTAANDFLVGSGNGAVVKKTLAETKAILGIGSVDTLPTTTGTGSIYAVTVTDFTLTAGKKVTVRFNEASIVTATLNVNGLGAKVIKKPSGLAFMNIASNGVYTFVYDGSYFVLQGEGGSGNAIASNLLSGKTCDTDAGPIVGTMPNYAGSTTYVPAVVVDGTSTIGRVYLKPPVGGYDGSAFVIGDDPDFISGNILGTKNIFGLQGTIPTMPDDGHTHYKSANVVVTASAGEGNSVYLSIPANSYTGSNVWVHKDAPDLLPGNILATKNILGVQGNIPLRSSEEYPGWRRAILGPTAAIAGRAHMSIPQGAYIDPTMPQGAGLCGIFIDDANFTGINIKPGISILGLASTMASKGAATITPSTANQSITANQYLTGVQTILGDPDLIAANIKAGINLFGVVGTCIDGTSMKKYATGWLTSSAATVVFDGLSRYSVTKTGLGFNPIVVIISLGITANRYPAVFFAGLLGADTLNSNFSCLDPLGNPAHIQLPGANITDGFILPWGYPSESVQWTAFG